MIIWSDIKNQREAELTISAIAKDVDQGKIDLGRRHYAQSVALSVAEAIICGVSAISLVELGVAKGGGLLDLCKAADFFRRELAYDIRVYGFDNGYGLPEPVDYRDHPEIWQRGQFGLGEADAAELRLKLPSYAELIIGDVGETIPTFEQRIANAPLAFVAIDVDFYFSTKRLLPLFDFQPRCYLPAVPVYVDDMRYSLTLNSWAGEQLAIREFNDSNSNRKIEENMAYKIRNFHLLHVLDHPLRTGEQPVRENFPICIGPLF